MSRQKAAQTSMKVKIVKTYGKLLAPALAATLVLGLTTINACSPSDRSTGDREEVISQNAAEAEAAEAQLASASANKGEAKAGDANISKVASDSESKKDTKHVAKSVAKAEHKVSRHVASAGGGVFVVQVGAFKVKENAEKLQAKLKQAGYSVEMQSIEHSKNGTLHLVRFPGIASKAEAETVVEDLHAKHDLSAQVLAFPATN